MSDDEHATLVQTLREENEQMADDVAWAKNEFKHYMQQLKEKDDMIGQLRQQVESLQGANKILLGAVKEVLATTHVTSPTASMHSSCQGTGTKRLVNRTMVEKVFEEVQAHQCNYINSEQIAAVLDYIRTKNRQLDQKLNCCSSALKSLGEDMPHIE